MRTKRTAAMAALAAFLVASGAACGGDDKGSLTFMSGGGTYQDATDEAFIQPFERETGVQVHDDPNLSYAKVKTMVDAGNTTIDVIPAEGYWAVQQCGKLLEPLDKSVVDTDRIDPELMQSRCGAPLLTYQSAIYYNTKTYPQSATPTGCRDFFDTNRFPGKRAAYSGALPNPLLECALLADGVSAEALYPLDLDRAFAKIEKLKPHLVFWNSGADSAQLMAAGEVAMALAWNGRAYAAVTEQGADFAPAYGEAFTHYDALVVPKGVKDKALAMKLVGYMMDAERQAKMTTLIPYSPANQDAKLEGLPGPLQEFLPATNPKLEKGVIVQDQRWWAENAEVVTKQWDATFHG